MSLRGSRHPRKVAIARPRKIIARHLSRSQAPIAALAQTPHKQNSDKVTDRLHDRVD